jgi:hypothetical protein
MRLGVSRSEPDQHDEAAVDAARNSLGAVFTDTNFGA